MNKTTQITTAALVAALLAGGGYWLGQRQAGTATTQASAPSTAKKILYYRNPMGLPDTSAVPKKDSMGMDYIPVFEGEDSSAASGQGKIVFYRNPMGLPDTSPVPKKDSMGMDYIPVYESEVSGPNFVRITPEKIQRLGVKTVAVTAQEVSRSVRAVGKIEIDERAVVTVSPRFEGWIEKLAASAVGDSIGRGQVLFEAYSPDIYAAQQEYRLAAKSAATLAGASSDARAGLAHLTEGGLARLKQWEVPADEIARLKNGGEPRRTISYRAPAGGIVLEKMAIQGARFMPGEVLFKIADLSRVWLQLDVPEQDLAAAKAGSKVKVTLDAYPGEVFNGKVDFVYPTLNTETRTAKVRVALANPGNKLKPGLFAQAELASGTAGKSLAIPDSAVIDSGKRQIVLVSLGEGRFEAREVKLGAHGNGFYAVQEGLGEGEQVVVSANFLIDAESNLKAAVSGMSKPEATTSGSASQPAASKPAEHAGHGG
ncbi:MAG: heavy metal efflux rane fusion protein, CzcB family [Proteobacteria bacterium]|nr:heavy metal efflux rane fusion protein, CzcB family [Pseudomonadota bacterium]